MIFIIDDFKQPLGDLVLAGLREARDQGFKFVSLPVMRLDMGESFSPAEKAIDLIIFQMQQGIEDFVKESPDTTTMSITVVVDENPAILKKFGNFMNVFQTS